MLNQYNSNSQKSKININKKFRPEIEGLRFVAALLVAIYHIWLSRVSGGVDVFFLISGFLITMSVISKFNRDGYINIVEYFGNLIKRLLPGILTVLIVVTILSYWILPHAMIGSTIQEIIASALYYENLHLIQVNNDYLDSTGYKSPVEHFWAMSIQGQFYLIWFLVFSLVFFLCNKFKLNHLKAINITLIIIFICSLIYSIFLTNTQQSIAYFHPLTRVWEFSLGGLLCININRIKLPNIAYEFIGWIGFIGIILCGLIINVSEMFPGYIALWPVICASFILLAGNSAHKLLITSFLSHRIMKRLGSISFGIYLWHWVLLSFYKYVYTDQVSILVGISIIVSSILLSYLMTKFIEEPIRNNTFAKSLKPLLPYALILCSLVIGLSYVNKGVQEKLLAVDFDNYPGAISEKNEIDMDQTHFKVPSAVGADDRPISYIDGNNQTISGTEPIIGTYGEINNYKHTILLAGGSHTTHYLGAFDYIGKKNNIKILTLTKSACRLSTEKHTYQSCNIWRENVKEKLEKLKETEDIDFIFTLGTAQNRYTMEDKITDGMIGYFKIFNELNYKVVASRDTPIFTFNIPITLDQKGFSKTYELMNRSKQIGKAPWEDRNDIPDNIHFVDFNHHLLVNEKYVPAKGNIIIYHDADHLSHSFSTTLGAAIEDEILNYVD